jgi:hypothetical protein
MVQDSLTETSLLGLRPSPIFNEARRFGSASVFRQGSTLSSGPRRQSYSQSLGPVPEGGSTVAFEKPNVIKNYTLHKVQTRR